MNNDTIKLIRKTSNVNSLMVIIFYMLDIALIRLGDLSVYHIAGKSAYYEDITQLVSYCIQYLVVVPIVLVVFRLVSGKKEGLKITACFRKPSMPAKWVAKWIVISFGLIYASNYINTFIFSYVQKASGTSLKGVDFTSSGTALGGVTSVLAMSVLAPFFEELMFRGTLFRNAEKCGQLTGIIMVGLTFGLWHGSYQQILYAAVMGMCACFMVAKTGSIFPSLILHFTMNTIGAIQSVALGSIDFQKFAADLEKGQITGTAPMIIIAVALLSFGLMIVGLVIFVKELRYHRDSFRLINFCPDVSQGKKIVIYLTAPVTILAFAGLIFITVRTALGLGLF